MTDEITKATMIALLARWQMAWFLKQTQDAIRDEAQKKSAEFLKTINDCKATAKSLGFDRDDDESWKRIDASFFGPAKQLYDRAKAPGMPEWNPVAKAEPEIDANMQKQDERMEQELPSARPSIRQFTLDQLALAGDDGAKAAEIRKNFEEAYSEEIHEKTVGMTLYRLLQDTLVRRQGHRWFLVPQNTAETKNPGGETPGLIKDLL